jgi:hypothetical protein
LHGNAKKPWMTSFLFKEIVFFFKKIVPGKVSLINRHLLVLDGHDSHVTLEAILEAQEMGLNMITLPSHTSHVFQPLDIYFVSSHWKQHLEQLEM